MKVKFSPFFGGVVCLGLLALAGCGKPHQPLTGIYEKEGGSMQTSTTILMLDSTQPGSTVFGLLSNQLNMYGVAPVEYSSDDLTVHFPSKKTSVLEISKDNKTLTCIKGCDNFGKVFHLSFQPSGQPIPDFVVTEYFNKYKQEAAH